MTSSLPCAPSSSITAGRFRVGRAGLSAVLARRGTGDRSRRRKSSTTRRPADRTSTPLTAFSPSMPIRCSGSAIRAPTGASMLAGRSSPGPPREPDLGQRRRLGPDRRAGGFAPVAPSRTLGSGRRSSTTSLGASARRRPLSSAGGSPRLRSWHPGAGTATRSWRSTPWRRGWREPRCGTPRGRWSAARRARPRLRR
jgi:hypothetical protein